MPLGCLSRRQRSCTSTSPVRAASRFASTPCETAPSTTVRVLARDIAERTLHAMEWRPSVVLTLRPRDALAPELRGARASRRDRAKPCPEPRPELRKSEGNLPKLRANKLPAKRHHSTTSEPLQNRQGRAAPGLEGSIPSPRRGRTHRMHVSALVGECRVPRVAGLLTECGASSPQMKSRSLPSLASSTTC